MQYTHYIPDESIGSQNLRPASTLAVDHKFAKAAIDEKSALLSKAGIRNQAQSARGRIRHAFKGTGKMGVAWVIEVIIFVFTVLFIAYEFWTSCTRDVGLPHCYGCYTSAFLTWSMIWVALWIVNLYTFLLLVSRDFEMYIGGGILSELMTNVLDRGIPRQGIVFYVAESVMLILWWIIGICTIISSNSCLRGGRIYGDVGRSGLMFWWMMWNIVIWIPLMIFGRFVLSPAKYIYSMPVEEKPRLIPRPAVPAPAPRPAEFPVASQNFQPTMMASQPMVLPPQPVVALPALPAPAVTKSMPAMAGGPTSPALMFSSAPPGALSPPVTAGPVMGSIPMGSIPAGGSVVLQGGSITLPAAMPASGVYM
jgi:hypothetical protein